MRQKITIPKKGNHIGEVIIEGMEHSETCQHELEELALCFGPIVKSEQKDHFDDENSVHDRVTVN